MTKKLLVTGASGFLGSNLCRIAAGTWDVIGTVHSHPLTIPGVRMIRSNITCFSDLKKIFTESAPDAVIHAAAVSRPEICQVEPVRTHKVNVDASINLAGLCAEHDIPCVFTSSDLVFDGLTPPYKEKDPVSPVNRYAEQKVCAELGMTDRYPHATICRMPLMFGAAPPHASSSLQPIICAMRRGCKIKLFTDEYRTPVSAGSAAGGLLLALGQPGNLYHLGGSERLSRFEFGKKAARLFKLDDAFLIPCLAKEVQTAAPRAPDVSLNSRKARAMGFLPLSVEEELKQLKDII